MSNLIFYCSGGLGTRLSPFLNIKNIFDYNIKLVWPKTMRLMCDFQDIFENKNIGSLSFTELDNLVDVENFHGSEGGLIASEYEFKINSIDSLLNLSRRSFPKPIDLFNINNLSHQNTIVFFNDLIGHVDKETVKENFFKLKPKKEIIDKINDLQSYLEINKDTVGIHARGTDFINEKLESYFPIIDEELRNGNDIFFCSDDPDWEKNIIVKYPMIKVRPQKNNVYKSDINSNYSCNVVTPLDATIDAYIDMVLLSKSNFKHFNPKSSFARLVNIIQ